MFQWELLLAHFLENANFPIRRIDFSDAADAAATTWPAGSRRPTVDKSTPRRSSCMHALTGEEIRRVEGENQ